LSSAGATCSWEEAVASWHDHVYAPLAQVIRSSGVLSDFPGRTQADLYLWIIEHRWYPRQTGALDDSAPVEESVREYAAEFSPWPARRMVRLARWVAGRLRVA
jgi:hypothetical protein